MKAVVFVDVQKDFIDGALRNEQAIAVTPKIVEFAKKCVADPDCKLYATRDTHEATKYFPNDKFDMTKLEDFCKDPNSFNEKPLIKTGYLATLEGQRLQKEHCIEGTDGWMIDNRLMDVFYPRYAKDETCAEDTERLIYNCTFVNTPTFGSFDLAEIIDEDFNETYQYVEKLHCKVKCLPKTDKKLDEIIICGFVSSICVVANAILLRAKFPNVKITVMKDLCAGITADDHNAAMKVLEMQQIDIK